MSRLAATPLPSADCLPERYPLARATGVPIGRRWTLAAILSACAVFGILPSRPSAAAPRPSAPAVPPGGSAETFKDWALRCTPGGGCVLEQRVLLKDDASTPLLDCLFQYDGEPPVLTVTLRVPLGVLLAPGLQLTIDGRATTQIPFHQCRLEGCFAQAPFSDRRAAALRRGRAAEVGYHLGDGRGLQVPLSLDGFAPGLRALGERLRP